VKKRINEEQMANFPKKVIFFILFQSGVLKKKDFGVYIDI